MKVLDSLSLSALTASFALLLVGTYLKVQVKAIEGSCLKNLRKIGQATQMYCQDFDGYYPMAYSSIAWPNWTTYNWSYRLEPYLHAGVTAEMAEYTVYGTYGGQKKNVSLGWADSGGSTWHCPADPTGSNISYGVNPFLAGADELQGDSIRKPSYVPSKRESDIQAPEIVLWAGDTTKGWHQDDSKYFEVYADWMRERDLPKVKGRTLSNDEVVAWYDEFLKEDNTDIRSECARPGGYGCKAPAYWHGHTLEGTGAAGMVFCDGHVKAMPFGSVLPVNVVPSPTSDQAATRP